MGLFSRSKPKIKVQSTKRDGFSGWIKCSGCHEMIHANELGQTTYCCPKCNYHYRFPLKERINLLTDENSFEEKFSHIQPVDPLKFTDSKPYKKRIEAAQEKTKRDEAVIVGIAKINGRKVALGVLDFSFMAGSMGSVVGERLTFLIEYALENYLPLIIVSASGGARMQESILSLMQMAKTSAALRLLHEKGIPYISVLTNPTTGGVTASFASLGDIILAEPDALIGFAGPRVVEQTIGQKLPPKAQKSEFLLEKGMIDAIVKRQELKQTIASLLDFLCFSLEKKQQEASEKIPEQLKKLLSFAEAKVSKKDSEVAHATSSSTNSL